jgi:hypothetical protein
LPASGRRGHIGSWGDSLVAHLGVDEGVLAPAVQPDGRPVTESDFVAARTATLDASRTAPVPRKRRYSRYRRYKAHFIGISCISGGATSLNTTRYRRYIGIFRT